MSTVIQENIKKQLQIKNMTAAELERRTGIPHAVINILHGRSKNPSIKTAQAIAKELGCSVEQLLEDDQNIKHTKQWNHELYTNVCSMVLSQIQALQLQPTPSMVGKWLEEVYTYALGSPELTVDRRFVIWLLERGHTSEK